MGGIYYRENCPAKIDYISGMVARDVAFKNRGTTV